MKKTTKKSSLVTTHNIWEIPLAETSKTEREIMKNSLQSTISKLIDTAEPLSKENFGIAWDSKRKLKTILKYESDERMGR